LRAGGGVGVECKEKEKMPGTRKKKEEKRKQAIK